MTNKQPSLVSRFEDPRDLTEALMNQRIVQGDKALAEALAAKGTLVEFAPGQLLIEQGAGGREIFFLLFGKAMIIVNGVRLYPRDHGVTVGEMSAINPQITRSASVEAEEHVVALKLDHHELDELGEQSPKLWRLLAMDVAGRLEQRNKFISRANPRPRVFLICSAEALDIAKAIRTGLDHAKADVVIWSDDEIFEAGTYPLEALEREVTEADFGIAIAEPDDLVRSRHRQHSVPRDNVIFELGFFMSRLGRARTILLVPRGEDVKLPSDFKGLTPISYKPEAAGTTMATRLGVTIDKIEKLILEKGVRSSLVEAK